MTVRGIRPERVTEWLAEQGIELVAPLRFTRIGHGRSNITVSVEDAHGSACVLRRPPRGPLLPSAHDIEREHRIISRLSAAGVPVPRPLALCTDEAVTGAPFFVMQAVEGHVLHRRSAAMPFAPHQRRESALSLMRTLARIHALDVDAIGLGDLARRDAYAERQLRRWRRQWERSKTEEDPRVERVAARLEARIPRQDGVAVVHGDYRLDNVIVDDDGQVLAVLDWELCTLGDPLADIGLLVAYTPATESEVLPIHEDVTLLPGFPSPSEMVDAYGAAAGRSLDALPFWTALGYWKIAVILQGVYRRSIEDPANAGERADELPATVNWLISKAEETASEAGFD